MKRHHCTFPGCGKSFSRPSHLQRHALNHSHAQWICSRCTAGFKRQDLLERHRARHVSKDRRAGGIGLGVLETKKKYLNSLDGASNRSITSMESPSTSVDNGETSQVKSTHSPWNEFQESALRPSNLAQSPVMSQEQELAHHAPEIGNIYHDITFDLVHFNVTRVATQRSGSNAALDLIPVDPGTSSLRADNTDSGQRQHGSPCLASSLFHSPSHVAQLPEDNPYPPSNARSQTRNESTSPGASIFPSVFSPSMERPRRVSNTSSNNLSSNAERRRPSIPIPIEKRNELLELIAEIRPVRPDGRLIDRDSPEFSLERMQAYFDLFLQYFNTSYPLLHLPTLDISDIDSIALLSFIIMGATYRDKNDHQLSVCLYDAIIPYIFGGLLSNLVPDLAILQGFMVLECYGMYRAGPFQRENAILIHCLLLNSISRISRYHVRACITLPGWLGHAERDWLEFAYTEQYKRLILFFFMWDTQNATCYSLMPNLSTQSLQLGLPCSNRLWLANSQDEWKQLVTDQDESYTFRNLVEEFIDSTYRELSTSYDMLDFSLALHGLMSVCNDIILFDNRSRYFSMLKTKESIWSTSREQMAYALSSWKAKYEAFAMDALRDMETESERSQFQRDNTGLYALYHMAHIVINCEIRHLQTACGAKAIFGHTVTTTDFEDSCNWIREWLRSSADSAGRAAWHAAHMIRDGMLNLKNWDVHGVFHYPWCLYIATLTCWAFHHFGAESADNGAGVSSQSSISGSGLDNRGPSRLCDHQSSPAHAEDLRRRSRASMNHLVATMASVTPTRVNTMMGKCCTHGLAIEMAKYLRTIRWTAAYEAMKVLEGLSGLPADEGPTP